MREFQIVSIAFSLIFSGLAYLNATSQTTILPNNPNIQYIGRFDMSNKSQPKFSWTGCQINLNFQGTSLKVTLDTWAETYFNIYIDGVWSLLTTQSSGKASNTLASGLSDTTHSAIIIKRDSPWLSHNLFNFIIDAGKQLVAPPVRQNRKIEFYGDSQLQGAQDEVPGTQGDIGSMIYDNNYKSYGAVTARAFDAEYSSISECGVSLTPYSTRVNLPDFYDRTGCSTDYSLWDFKKWQAEVVCINLGTNDNPYPSDFSPRYVTFVQKIRQKYPLAHIFLLLGPMYYDPAMPKAITDAIQTLKNKGENKVYFYKFTTTAKYGHPRASEHQACANELIAKIKTKIWGVNDSIAPNAPTKLAIKDSTTTSLTLSWTVSTDDIGVVGYQVFKNGQSCGITTADTFKLTGLYCGISYSISVKARDNYGNWSNASDTLFASTNSCINTGVDENAKNQEILIYPNPGSKTITVSNLPANEGVSVFTIDGKIVSKQKPLSSSVAFDVASWTKGIYIFNVQLENDSIVKRVVVE